MECQRFYFCIDNLIEITSTILSKLAKPREKRCYRNWNTSFSPEICQSNVVTLSWQSATSTFLNLQNMEKLLNFKTLYIAFQTSFLIERKFRNIFELKCYKKIRSQHLLTFSQQVYVMAVSSVFLKRFLQHFRTFDLKDSRVLNYML